jgi:hypothetical protein
VPLNQFIDSVSDFISVSCKLDLSDDEAAAQGLCATTSDRS